MSRSLRALRVAVRATVTAAVAVGVCATALVVPAGAAGIEDDPARVDDGDDARAGGDPVRPHDGDDPAALALLDRAVARSGQIPLRGRMTVAAFGRGGPQVTTVEVVRRGDGRSRATRRSGWELGRDDDGSYLRSPRTGELLRLGDVERLGFDRDRFLDRYRVRAGGTSRLRTGTADTILVETRDTGVRRETLHVDRSSGVIVRRETRDRHGGAVRVVAYTELTVEPGAPPTSHVPASRVPAPADEVQEVALDPVARRSLVARGVPARSWLPGGFALVDAAEVRGTDTPTVHLIYSDGLYTLSLYVQEGRLAVDAVADAEPWTVSGGGTVWRWPGSEPRRVVWTGDGRTFTALTDAPSDDLVDAVASLPNDPAPSTLRRLTRGLARVVDRSFPPRG